MSAQTPPPQHLAARKRVAQEFVQRWSGRGYEKGEAQPFWIDLLTSVAGMAHAAAQVEFERKTRTGGYIDVLIPESRTLVEQKSQGVNLDTPEPRQGVMVTPFEQAKRYADSLPNPQRPDFIVTCNFATFRVHDLRCDDPKETFTEFSPGGLGGQAAPTGLPLRSDNLQDCH